MSTWIYECNCTHATSEPKRLKMYVQATFVFFCAKLYKYFFINTNFMIGNLFVVLYLLYFF